MVKQLHRPPDRASHRLDRDLRLLAAFIRLFCADRHRELPKQLLDLPGYGLPLVKGKRPELCAGCRKLLAHAIVKRTHCPFDPKPACKKCPKHCYAPKYRAEIRAVMRYSGRRMVLRGRIDYLLHLLF